ncbi:MAG: cytochrome d ubiquinol oxidase subunit II [Legionellales bacterium]|nr:cytochrome d ubiquinol oxidase subunit II [Legionellales bacterium]
MIHHLPLIWLILIACGIAMYIILDGFDLGIGILSIFIHEENHRDIMMASILPVWDGNQTWLVFGGASLYGAFPLAFSRILPALYLPILIMVIALIFRGVAFEFHLKARKTKRIWQWSFFLGSLIATIMQGFILSVFVMGFEFNQDNELISKINYTHPFSLVCIGGLITGYCLLAATWLIMKTIPPLQNLFFTLAHRLLYLLLFFVMLVSILSPISDPDLKSIWFNPHTMFYLAFLPLTTLLLFLTEWIALKKHDEHLPFLATIGIFLLCFSGFVISVYPYLVPRYLTYLQAAANTNTLLFMAIGAFILLPILLLYTGYAYYTFRGKVTEKIEY